MKSFLFAIAALGVPDYNVMTFQMSDQQSVFSGRSNASTECPVAFHSRSFSPEFIVRTKNAEGFGRESAFTIDTEMDILSGIKDYLGPASLAILSDGRTARIGFEGNSENWHVAKVTASCHPSAPADRYETITIAQAPQARGYSYIDSVRVRGTVDRIGIWRSVSNPQLTRISIFTAADNRKKAKFVRTIADVSLQADLIAVSPSPDSSMWGVSLLRLERRTDPFAIANFYWNITTK